MVLITPCSQCRLVPFLSLPIHDRIEWCNMPGEFFTSCIEFWVFFREITSVTGYKLNDGNMWNVFNGLDGEEHQLPVRHPNPRLVYHVLRLNWMFFSCPSGGNVLGLLGKNKENVRYRGKVRESFCNDLIGCSNFQCCVGNCTTPSQPSNTNATQAATVICHFTKAFSWTDWLATASFLGHRNKFSCFKQRTKLSSETY